MSDGVGARCQNSGLFGLFYESDGRFEVRVANNGFDAGMMVKEYHPDVIVLGGGLSNISELYGQGLKSVRKYTFNDVMETPIVKNKYGDSAGVIGAALVGK